MWAMMPMFRVRSSGYCGSTGLPFPSAVRLFKICRKALQKKRRGGPDMAPLSMSRPLPAVMRERLVGLRHLVGVFSLLHGGAAIVRGIQELSGQLPRHALLRAPPGRADQPPHAERGAPL